MLALFYDGAKTRWISRSGARRDRAADRADQASCQAHGRAVGERVGMDANVQYLIRPRAEVIVPVAAERVAGS